MNWLIVISVLLMPDFYERCKNFLCKLWDTYKENKFAKTVFPGQVYQRKELDKFFRRRKRHYGGAAIFVKVVDVEKTKFGNMVIVIYSDKIETLGKSTDENEYDVDEFMNAFEKTTGTIAEEDLENLIK